MSTTTAIMVDDAFERMAAANGFTLATKEIHNPNGTTTTYYTFRPDHQTFKPIAEVCVHEGWGSWRFEPFGATRDALGGIRFEGWDNPEQIPGDSDGWNSGTKTKARVRWPDSTLDTPIKIISDYITSLRTAELLADAS